MKPVISLLLLSCLGCVSYGQEMASIFDKNTKITWLGLDFTGATFIGDHEKLNEEEIRRQMVSWNEIIISEKEKFDIALSIDKVSVEDDIVVTMNRNEKLDAMKLLSNDPKDHLHLKPGDIEGIIKDYDFNGKSGIGLIYNVESFNKLNQEASIWITFINMDSKQVYFSERMIGKPSGFGLRNYWANAVFDILKQMRKRQFEAWRKKYSSKS